MTTSTHPAPRRHAIALVIVALAATFMYLHLSLLFDQQRENQHRTINELAVISVGLLDPAQTVTTRERLNYRMGLQRLVSLTVTDEAGRTLLRMGAEPPPPNKLARWLPLPPSTLERERAVTLPKGSVRAIARFDQRPMNRELGHTLLIDLFLLLLALGLFYRLSRTTTVAAPPAPARQETSAPITDQAQAVDSTTPSAEHCLANLNQSLMTPLGHIRAGTDALADDMTSEQQRATLAMVRTASDRLRQTFENLIDGQAIENGRLHFIPRRVVLRDMLEDLCAEWLPSAQESGLLIHLIVFRDVPEAIDTDGRLLRRALGNLLARGLRATEQGSLTITLQEGDAESADLAVLEFLIGSSDPRAAERLASQLATPLSVHDPESVDPASAGIWLAQQYAELMRGELDTFEALKGEGSDVLFRLRLPARVLSSAPKGSGRLTGQRCRLMIEDACLRRAWRNTLLSLGAELVEDDAPNSIQWLFIHPANATTIQQARQTSPTHLVGLTSDIDLRGRPRDCPDGLDFCLPAFIRQRSLLTELSREQAPSSKPRSGSFPELQVLVIDDDPVYRGYLRDMLEKLGLTVFTANSGAEGVRLARHRDLDIILTDMNMPGLDGAAVTRYLRRDGRHANTPIIAVTANVQANVHETLHRAGVDALLCKPISRSELINTLERFIQAAPASESGSVEEDINNVLRNLLCQELPDYYRALEESPRDHGQLRQAAHKLRGAAACCQESTLQQAAGDLEDYLVHDPHPEPIIINRLRQTVLRQIRETAERRDCEVG